MPNENTRDFDGINAACRALQEKCEREKRKREICEQTIQDLCEKVSELITNAEMGHIKYIVVKHDRLMREVE